MKALVGGFNQEKVLVFFGNLRIIFISNSNSYISDPFKLCPEGWEYFHHSEKCYKLVKKKMADANAYCKEKTGGKVREI